MSIFEIVFWAAIVVEMIVRAPINKQRKQESMSKSQVTSQEKTLLLLLFLGMFLLPLIYSATNWLDFANYTLPGWANWLGVVLILGALFVFWRAHADLFPPFAKVHGTT